MTEIVFSYNPIQVRADITIGESEIAKTSNLYRYRNTPLEDWIDVLIPELVDYSNDDNIRIEICSMQKYIDEINKSIRAYEKKHRHIDIEVAETPSTGYKGRLNKLSQMFEEVKSEGEISDSESYPLNVIFVSLADGDEYEDVLTNIFPNLKAKANQAILIAGESSDEDGFEFTNYEMNDLDDRHINARILIFPSLNECPNKYWRLLKEKVNSDEDFMLISVLNSKPKKNDELFDYIAEQLEKKGKISKSRFVFISDNPEDNHDYIQDEYGVKVNEMLEYDNAEEVLEYIKLYMQNVCYVKKIRNQSALLREYLKTMQERISLEAEKTKNCLEVNLICDAYKKAANTLVEHYESLTLVESGNMLPESATNDFIDILTNSIKNFMVDEVITKTANVKNEIESAALKVDGAHFFAELSVEVSTDKLLSLFSTGAREEDIMILTENVLNDFIKSYLSEHYSLVARANDVLAEGITLPDEYSISVLFKEKIDVLCEEIVKRLCGIKKKTEYGQKMRFFAWVTENVSRYDIGLSTWYGEFNNRILLDYNDRDFSEVSEKIKRRLKTIEQNIELMFRHVFKEISFDAVSEILEERITIVQNLAQTSVRRVEDKCDELLGQMEINEDDKGKINGIDSLIDELEEIISL